MSIFWLLLADRISMLSSRMNNIIQVSLQMIMLLLLPLLFVFAYGHTHRDCGCLNGGTCTDSSFYAPCECPPLLIGKYCQTKAQRLQNNPYHNVGYIDLDFGFKHFVFLPEAGNYFRFTFNVCAISNPGDFQSLIFMTSDQSDGSADYHPPIISAAKIKAKQGSCLSFSSPYIEIKKEIPTSFRRIIIGVRALQKDLSSYFYRTVTGKYLHNIPQQILEQQPPLGQNHVQRLYVNATYEHYKQSFLETVLRKLIRVVIGIGILVAIFLFCRIALFTYGVDVKHVFLWAYRIKNLCRKLTSFKREVPNYRNYLRLKAKIEDEEELKLLGKDECAICLQPFLMDEIIQQTACRHIYHLNCLEDWQLKNQICPLCRRQLVKVE